MKNTVYKTKVFVDTNVLLDFLDSDREKHRIARELFHLIYSNLVEAAVSTQSILEVAYLSRKSNSVSNQDLRDAMLFLLVHTNSGYLDTFDLSAAFKDPHSDIEDNAQISFAYNQCCDFIITNDKKLLSRDVPKPMQVMTPEEFVDNCRA